MEVDKFFKQIQRRTERDLYRKTIRTAYKSQKSITTNLGSNLKAVRLKNVAKELFWFFLSVFFGFLFGYLIYEVLGIVSKNFVKHIEGHVFTTKNYFFYFLAIISFVGVYIARLIVWSLKYLSK
jgi:hypothetical protein